MEASLLPHTAESLWPLPAGGRIQEWNNKPGGHRCVMALGEGGLTSWDLKAERGHSFLWRKWKTRDENHILWEKFFEELWGACPKCLPACLLDATLISHKDHTYKYFSMHYVVIFVSQPSLIPGLRFHLSFPLVHLFANKTKQTKTPSIFLKAREGHI